MFNRVKTIGLLGVGLLAMLLGTKAEAHYMYANGKYYSHSVGCQATIGSVPVHPDPLDVKCQVYATKVELLCPGEVVEYLNFEQSPLSLVTSHVQIPAGQTQVDVLVDDSPIRNLCDCDPPGCDPLQDIKALVRNMVATVTISKCASPVGDPCSVLLVTSTAAATCEFPALFNTFANYPAQGTEYVDPPNTNTCTVPIKVHVH